MFTYTLTITLYVAYKLKHWRTLAAQIHSPLQSMLYNIVQALESNLLFSILEEWGWWAEGRACPAGSCSRTPTIIDFPLLSSAPLPPHRHLWPPWIVWNIVRTGQPWLDELRVEAQCVLHYCWLGAWHTATVTTCLACSTEGGGPVCFALLLVRCLTQGNNRTRK